MRLGREHPVVIKWLPRLSFRSPRFLAAPGQGRWYRRAGLSPQAPACAAPPFASFANDQGGAALLAEHAAVDGVACPGRRFSR
jgi:hypothetical protein